MVVKRKINRPCSFCGREENGKWFIPCPSDDCPSHDKKKPKRLKRQEYRSVGTVSFEFEANAMAHTEKEAEKIVRDVLDRLNAPKATRIKVGKRSRLLKNGRDYFVEQGSVEVSNVTTEPAEEHEFYIT